jgi:hypothetical protein
LFAKCFQEVKFDGGFSSFVFFMLRQAFEKKRLVFNYVDKSQDLYLPSLRSVLNDQIVQGSKPGRNFVSGVGCLLRVLRRL